MDWKRWTYYEWNRKLGEYFLGARGPEERDAPIERIAATPEELARVAGEPPENAVAVVEAFAALIRRELKPGQGFCDYCLGYHWDPDDYPPFFAMLWFTCLVAYGYPERGGSFSERWSGALGKAESFHAPGADKPCLPALWQSVADWTRERQANGSDIRRLDLPSDVGRRTVIGYSHFLAFPNRFDRAKLRSLLEDTDLVGTDPPIQLLLDTLLRQRRIFSSEFQEDLDEFIREYQNGTRDPRASPFWRAVRQEAISASETSAPQAPTASMIFAVDDDGLFPVLTVSEAFAPPEGYLVEAFDDGSFGRRLVGPEGDRELPIREAFASGRFLGLRDARFLRSGVMPLRESDLGLYLPASGEDVHGCRSALVQESLVQEFTKLFRGIARPSIIAGWAEVHDAHIRQVDELPPVLGHAISLLRTTELPSVAFVGGIPASDGFLLVPGFLPHLRAPGVLNLEVMFPNGSRVACTPSTVIGEWTLPDGLAEAGEYAIVATWPVQTNAGPLSRERTAVLRLRAHALSNEYKGLPSGAYYEESCPEHEREVTAPDEPHLTVTTDDPRRSSDTLEFDVTARWLGPGVGEMSLAPRRGFDWLAVGPKKRPELLVYVGGHDAPTPPRAARSPDAGDRRHWLKALHVNESQRWYRVPDTLEYVPWPEAPLAIRDAWAAYRRHTVTDVAEPCEPTDLETAVFSPLPRSEPDVRVDRVLEAIAATSVARRGLRYSFLADLFAQLLGHRDLLLVRQLIRSWVESGVIDEVRHAVTGRIALVARRLRFVLVRRGPAVDATLTGLVTPIMRRLVMEAAHRLGMTVIEMQPGSPWQPGVLRVRGHLNRIEEISASLALSPPLWLDWPSRTGVPPGLDANAALQSLFRTTPPNSFVHEASWDWEDGTFKRCATQSMDGAQLSRRIDRNQVRIYVLSLNGTALSWTFQRSWALLAAYDLRGTPGFVADEANGRLTSRGRAPLHLPLPIARLCTVIGEGLPGPSATSTAARLEYMYPFGRRLFSMIRQVVPASWLMQ